MEELEPQSAAELEVEVTSPDAGTVLVRVTGELDLSNIERLEATVAPAIARAPGHLILDATGLEFADSSAIALWVRWSGAVERFELRDLSPLLRRVLAAMGLDQKLELTP
jgi:anti-anti-sigma factor